MGSGCTIPHLWKVCKTFWLYIYIVGHERNLNVCINSGETKESLTTELFLLRQNCLLEAHISHLVHPHISPKSVRKYSSCWGTRTMSQKCAKRHTLSRISQGIKTIAKILQDDNKNCHVWLLFLKWKISPPHADYWSGSGKTVSCGKSNKSVLQRSLT